jgi:hypothetical protein
MSDSAWLSNSPAKVITKLVISPHSCSCILEAITTILAAGWATSSSYMTVAASEVTKILSRWLITIFFMPLGPREVFVILEMSLQACMFLIIASSRPL